MCNGFYWIEASHWSASTQNLLEEHRPRWHLPCSARARGLGQNGRRLERSRILPVLENLSRKPVGLNTDIPAISLHRIAGNLTGWFSRTLRAQFALLLLVSTVLAGCATLPEKLPKGPEGHAALPAKTGHLADLENSLRPQLGVRWALPGGYSTPTRMPLRWRLALIDSATTSLDIAYYFWWEDATGQLLMKHVIEAADRGVKVRILLDDLVDDARRRSHSAGAGLAEPPFSNAHPNIELRLFNAFRARSLLGRGIDFPCSAWIS